MKTALTSTIAPPNNLHQSQLFQQRKISDTAQANINLVTKEGDTITIAHKISNDSSQQMINYSDIEKSISNEMNIDQFSLNITGDLNDQELADLANLLNKLGSIAEDFFSGDMDDAIAGAMNIGEMGTVAKLEANFSHSTAISSYLKGPHPVPDMQDMLLDQVYTALTPKRGSDEKLKIADTLQAQWQQFLEYFENKEQQNPTIVESKHKSDDFHKAEKHLIKDFQKTAKKMFHDAEKTIHKHPRLTPMIPSIADLAVDKNFSNSGANRDMYALANTLKDQFSQEYSNWLI